MKIFTYIVIALAFGLIVFNVFQLDFENLTDDNSLIALIGIVAAFCAILILLILKLSKSIEDKLNDR